MTIHSCNLCRLRTTSSSALRIWDVEVTIGLELGSELIAEYTGTPELKRGGK
jgi:hypothetical protein